MESGRKGTPVAIAEVAALSHKAAGAIRRRPDGVLRQMDTRLSQDGWVRPLGAELLTTHPDASLRRVPQEPVGDTGSLALADRILGVQARGTKNYFSSKAVMRAQSAGRGEPTGWGVLVVCEFTEFTVGSGRSSYFVRECFRRRAHPVRRTISC